MRCFQQLLKEPSALPADPMTPQWWVCLRLEIFYNKLMTTLPGLLTVCGFFGITSRFVFKLHASVFARVPYCRKALICRRSTWQHWIMRTQGLQYLVRGPFWQPWMALAVHQLRVWLSGMKMGHAHSVDLLHPLMESKVQIFIHFFPAFHFNSRLVS